MPNDDPNPSPPSDDSAPTPPPEVQPDAKSPPPPPEVQPDAKSPPPPPEVQPDAKSPPPSMREPQADDRASGLETSRRPASAIRLATWILAFVLLLLIFAWAFQSRM